MDIETQAKVIAVALKISNLFPEGFVKRSHEHYPIMDSAIKEIAQVVGTHEEWTALCDTALQCNLVDDIRVSGGVIGLRWEFPEQRRKFFSIARFKNGAWEVDSYGGAGNAYWSPSDVRGETSNFDPCGPDDRDTRLGFAAD